MGTILFINAAFRKQSRSYYLAQEYLHRQKANIVTVDLASQVITVLNRQNLDTYLNAVSSRDFSDAMFDFAKQFQQAEEIVIAAPFWNLGLPAILHDYLELVCTQGITFDLSPQGNYIGLCKAKKLVLIMTAGGPLQKPNHAWGWVESLAKDFWQIDTVKYYVADALDIKGVNPAEKLQAIVSSFEPEGQ